MERSDGQAISLKDNARVRILQLARMLLCSSAMKNSNASSYRSRPFHVSLFGASPDTGNQGVNALHDATLTSLAARGVRSATVFGFTASAPHELAVDNQVMMTERLSAYRTSRWYSPKSLAMLGAASRLGGCGHAGARALLRSNAVLDLSAGDSFTDLYGWKRFLATIEPKRIAQRAGLPLILLPQTIGPFQSSQSRRMARQLLIGATQVWVRDEDSFSALEELLGEQSEQRKYRRGVDMAFLLRPSMPVELPSRIASWIADESSGTETVGINVSGLIYNTPAESSEQFALRLDYREVVGSFVQWLLRESNARIVLVPHVLTESGSRESDFCASQSLLGSLDESDRGRVAVLPPNYNAAELKGLIGQLDWFCGTRMHSTIAALGSGVPSASLAYSMKTRGVFAGCDMQDSVIEMRDLDTHSAVERLKTVWRMRQKAKAKLRRKLPQVLEAANVQVDQIVSAIAMPRSGGMESGRRWYPQINNGRSLEVV
ncbi:MAG: polysaccharide pyruvyl transferase family protein [Planctomycetota bacterium]